MQIHRLVLVLMILAWPLDAAAATDWSPPEPDPQGDDWVQLVSGEWLQGELKRLRNEVLDFDSDKLGLLNLKWEDVAAIRSPNPYTYVFSGLQAVIGTAVLQDSLIVIRTEQGEQRHAREELLSIFPGGDREIDLWSARATLGIVQRSGNTNQSDINVLANLTRASTVTRLFLGYASNFGRIEGQRNIENHNGQAKVDAYVSNRFYLTPFALDVFSDKFQNIDMRLSPSVGLGFTVFDEAKFKLEAELGAGYQWTWYTSVEAGQDRHVNQGSVIPTLRTEWDPTSDLEIKGEYNVRIGVPDAKDSFHHLFGTLSFDLTSIWSFELSASWDHVETPRPDSEGRLPKRDDFRMAFGVGLDFN